MASEGEFPKTDGDVLYASEVNNFARVQMKTITVSAEQTTNTSGWQDYPSTSLITINANGGAIIAIDLVAEMKQTGYGGGLDQNNLGINITGTTLGTYTLSLNQVNNDASNVISAYWTTGDAILIGTHSGSYVTRRYNTYLPLILTDDTTTVQVRWNNVGSGTSIETRNLILKVYYINNLTDI